MAPWLWLASFSPDNIPHPDFSTSPTPFVLLLVGGMGVALAGHLFRSKTLVAMGIGAAFLGTFLLPVIIFIGRS